MSPILLSLRLSHFLITIFSLLLQRKGLVFVGKKFFVIFFQALAFKVFMTFKAVKDTYSQVSLIILLILSLLP